MQIFMVGVDKKYNAEYFFRKAFETLNHSVYFKNEYAQVERQFLSRVVHSRTSLFHPILSTYEVNRTLIGEVRNIDPDIVIIFKGELISTRTLRELSNNYKIYLFYPDVYKFTPILKNRLHYFRTVFTAANNKERYNNLGAKRTVTIPWACDPEFHRRINLERIIPVSFIGTAYRERKKVVSNIKSDVYKFGDFWGKRDEKSFPAVTGDDYIKIINKTRISLNIQASASIVGDAPTMRTFELAGSGAFQLSDLIHSLKVYFPQMVTYRSIEELNELIEYYLDNYEEADEIGLKCQDTCISRFKYTNSAMKIIQNL